MEKLVAPFIALVFIAWPIVGKYSKATGSWVGTLVMLGTFGAVAILSQRELLSGPRPNAKAVFLLLLVAIANGVAVWLYALKSSSDATHTSVFVVTVSVLMVVFAPLLGALLNHEIPSMKQVAGYVTATVTVYLLTY